MSEIVITVGYPASGKSTLIEQLSGYERLNRDLIGGGLEDVAKELSRRLHSGGKKNFVLDNTYGMRKRRKEIIEIAKTHGMPVRCLWLNTSIEDAQVNAVTRMVQRYGRLLMPEEITAKRDPNTFPVAVLFNFKRDFEPPEKSEGFESVEVIKFERRFNSDYKGKALFLDYDGTLRKTKNPDDKYPRSVGDISILPGRAEVLKKYRAEGYKLLGVSNQSGVAKGDLSLATAAACFAYTNAQLGVEIESAFCPHQSGPASCYCRKPQVGMVIDFIERYRLDRSQCIMVGDMTTDKTCATRSGIKYIDANVFFK